MVVCFKHGKKLKRTKFKDGSLFCKQCHREALDGTPDNYNATVLGLTPGEAQSMRRQMKIDYDAMDARADEREQQQCDGEN